jgi:UDP:flavonoid glycosyltransferase YjiC (YdhE family)
MATMILSSLGSRGDCHPLLALGLRLRERGHRVRFALPQHIADDARALGFETIVFVGDVTAAIAPFEHEIYRGGSSIEQFRLLLQHDVLPHMDARVAQLCALCADADLLVASSVHIPASIVADVTGMRWASVLFSPLSVPSAFIEPIPHHLPIPGLLQRQLTRLSWMAGAALLRGVADRPINAYRAKLGLPPRHDQLLLGSCSDQLVAIAASPSFVPPPPDWPPHVHMTGFCFWDAHSTWVDPALDAFLDSAQPVIAVSAGSMAPDVPTAFRTFYHNSVAAARALGARALVIGAAPDEAMRGDDVFVTPYAPFSAVYPRCQVVINHGGMGSIAQALRAGVPLLAVPWGLDQGYNAGQVVRRGLGRTLDARTYSVEKATAALHTLRSDPSYRQQSQRLCDQMQREDGAAALATAVQGLV